MNLNPFQTRLTALAWITGWKILDVATTLPLAAQYGWGGELNVFVRTLPPVIDPVVMAVGTIFLGAAAVWFYYNRVPGVAEGVGITIPIITIGNALQVAGFKIGGLVTVAALPGLLTVYYFRDWQLFFFDDSLETIELKHWWSR